MNVWHRLLLAVVCGVAVASVYAAQPMLEPMGHHLGLDASATGWFVAVGQIGYLIGLVLLVPLGDMLDRRRLIAIQLTATAAGAFTTAWAPTAWQAFAGLAWAGMFAVVVQTTVAYTAAISSPRERGRNIGVVTSGVVIGILGGRIVAGTLAETWNWQGVYLLLAALAVGLAAAVLVMLPADPRTGRTVGYGRVIASLGGLFTQRLFWTRGLIAFFLFASFGTLWSGMALPLADEPWRLGETEIGLFGIAGLAGALGAARAGRWADTGRTTTVAGIALALLTVSWAAIGQLPQSLLLLIVGIVVLDFAIQAVHVGNQHQLTVAHPARTSSVIGGYMVFYSLGSALGAIATTALYSAWGWAASSLLGAGFAACALAVWAIDRRPPAHIEPSDQKTTTPRPATAAIPGPH